MMVFKRYTPSISFMFLVLIALFASCNNGQKTKETSDYKFFTLKQQGWKSKRVNQYINDINYTATEVPLQYYLLRHQDDPTKVDSLFEVYERERILEVEFQHTNEADLLLPDYTNKSYEAAVKYMAFAIEKDFTVVTTSNDTIKCAGVNFERNFKIAPFKRVLLYFNDIDPNENIKLIYQDHLFGNGIIKFGFNQTPLKL